MKRTIAEMIFWRGYTDEEIVAKRNIRFRDRRQFRRGEYTPQHGDRRDLVKRIGDGTVRYATSAGPIL